jgi:cell division protein FtsI/penicillin-binding protein 2
MLPDIRDGMLAAVLYGTARRSYAGEGEQPLGKTGTCSDSESRVGWFVSYADQQHPKIVLAVLMRGQSANVKGAMAAEIAGRIYKRLDDVNYFAQKTSSSTPARLAATSVATPATRAAN